MSAVTLWSGKVLEGPRKYREIEHEVEVKKRKPNKDQDTPSNGKEVGKDEKKPYKQVPTFSW